MGYEGYVSLVSKGQYVRRANLVHIPLFLWGDNYGRDKIFSQANSEILSKLSKLTGTAKIKSTDFIYKNGDSYRFSKNVAQQCAAFVRQSFLQRRYEAKVSSLRPRTIKKKKKAKDLLKGAMLAKDGKHVGVFFGETAKAIQAFRTNMRDETGETKHTGYVVGIPHHLESKSKPVKNKRDNAKLSFRKFSKEYLGKKLVKSETVYLADKLAWLEHGTKRQQARRLYSIAIVDYLKEAGFEVGTSYFSTAASLKPGTHKAKVKRGSKAEKNVKSTKEGFVGLLQKAVDLELGLKTITRKANK